MMKWYKSLPLAVATGAVLTGGCVYYSDITIRGRVVNKEEVAYQANCGIQRDYSINIEDENGFVMPFTFKGESCFLSSLQKEIESGDRVILKGYRKSEENIINLQKYKVLKDKKNN